MLPDFLPKSPTQYPDFIRGIHAIPQKALRKRILRLLCRTDLYFLLRYVLSSKLIRQADGKSWWEHPWLFARCREVQAAPNNHIDIWFREAFKTTVISFGLTIQDILNDPEITVGMFSHSRPLAKRILRQIKTEFEQNRQLKTLFPDILWQEPFREASKWSEDDGIIVRRKSNPAAATVEAWGLLDGQPTGKHFKLRVYDDVVDRDTVSTPEMISKLTEAWQLSSNLGMDGGWERYIGTRYAYGDTYKAIIDSGAVKTRVYPCMEPASMQDGVPVLFSREYLEQKYKKQGAFVFACHGTGTRVLMGDWTEKPIEEVEIGDTVVGWTMEPGKRSQLVRSKVLARQSKTAPRIKITVESGRSTVCTPDHKWYTGRSPRGKDSHRAYIEAEAISALIPLYNPEAVKPRELGFESGYLAGIFDGEGSVSGGALHIHQSHAVNPHICKRIKESLTALEFDWKETFPPGKPGATDFFLRGGRSEKIRFLRQCAQAKSTRIVDMLYKYGRRGFGHNLREEVIRREVLEDGEVWNIQTETGNYFAEGFASKNCQMLCNPVADNMQGFKLEHLSYYSNSTFAEREGKNVYILVDAANAKRKRSDYTCIWVIGAGEDRNFYILDVYRDRWNLMERTAKLFDLHALWHPVMEVRYESYGMESDKQHIEYVQEQRKYRFHIVPVRGKASKVDRISGRLGPLFETKRFIFPHEILHRDYQGKEYNAIDSFVNEEYKAFPVGLHDDMLDALSRIEEEDHPILWPYPGSWRPKNEDRWAMPDRKPEQAVSWMAG